MNEKKKHLQNDKKNYFNWKVSLLRKSRKTNFQKLQKK